MKKYFLATLATLLFASPVFAQHSDIEFGFDDASNPQTILFESDEFTSEGIQIAEGSFSSLLPGGDFFADSPGFITAADEGFLVNAGDDISIRFLNAAQDSSTSLGVGYVNFYNQTTNQLEAAGQIEISNQGPTDVSVFNGQTVSGDESLFLSSGSDGTQVSNAPAGEPNVTLGAGEIHNHLLFDLQGTEDVGAYGLLFQFEADVAGAGEPDGTVDFTSAPIWLVFNNGLDEEVFEGAALAAFGVGTAVPEPTSGIVLLAASGAMLTRRRRRM